MDFLRSLIQDLENGKQYAHQIRTLLQQLQGSDGADLLDHDHQYYYKGLDHHSTVVVSTFDNALSMLQRCDLFTETTNVEYKTEGGLTPKSSTPKNRRGCFKRRKIAQSDIVIIIPNLIEDCYAWRKYGQKNILNKKYPRNYYRCTHKFEQECQTSKQVEKMSEKPDQYRVIYKGEHTCKTLVTNTPLIISDDHDHENSSFFLNFKNPTPPKLALNPFICTSSPSLPSSSTPSPSPSSSSPFAMVKQEFCVPIKDGNQSSDMSSTITTTAFDQGDVISLSIDVEQFYSSGVAYHGMDDEDFSKIMADFTVFDDVMMKDILCV